VNYYNENDPKAVAWLLQLIENKLIPKGHVDDRSITEVKASDLKGYTQHHFFAGIGGWSCALDLVGWPETKPVCTCSCPCGPFSLAGLLKALADPRHLWPHFYRIAREQRFAVIFGEQVENAIRLQWLDGVYADMEAEGYAVGAIVLGAHSRRAPHKRNRLLWVADLYSERCDSGREDCGSEARAGTGSPVCGASGELEYSKHDRSGDFDTMAHDGHAGLEGRARSASPHECEAAERSGSAGSVANVPDLRGTQHEQKPWGGALVGEVHTSERLSVDPWGNYDILHCTDGNPSV
jgi:DNA (cytosine-5)-methyltransferase 1